MENKNKNQNDEFDFNSNQSIQIDDNNSTDFDVDEDSGDVNIEEGKGEENDLFSNDNDNDNDNDNYDYDDETPVFNEEVTSGELPEVEDEEAKDEDEEIDEDFEDDSSQVIISKTKIVLAKQLLENIAENNEKLINLFGGFIPSEDEERINISQIGEGIINEDDDSSGKIIEGVFDGENMIGPDGKQYTVPSNYASKSKLVEGDLLKLTITGKGTFVYKQTKPIDRERVVGILERNEDGSFVVVSDDRKWKVLTASITYFKGNPGDETIALVPKGSDSIWGAVENIIRNK